MKKLNIWKIWFGQKKLISSDQVKTSISELCSGQKHQFWSKKVEMGGTEKKKKKRRMGIPRPGGDFVAPGKN